MRGQTKIQDRRAQGRDVEQSSGNMVFNRSQNTVFSEQGLDILLIKNYEDVKIPTLAAYDVLVIDYHSPQRSLELLTAIRASVYDEIYLKPCFLLVYQDEAGPIESSLADGLLEQASIIPHYARIEKILAAQQEILGVQSDFNGRKVLLKLIRYLYTRDAPLTPVPARSSHTGYAFPFLEANVQQFEYQEIFDLLDAGVERGLLKTDFVDKLHLCSNCNGGFINYREVCVKCGSAKTHSQHTIHHFVCGYVGPESDFQNHNRLTCPKCDRHLRHIGVDYDKPSLILECENGHVFQEPEMETYCFNCHDRNSIEKLKDYEVNEYQLTASGANVALSGESREQKEAGELEGFVSFSVFKTFLKMEIERQKLTKKESSITYVNLMMSPATLKHHKEDYEGFSKEIARLFKGQLMPTEIVTFLNDDVFLVISPEQKSSKTSERFEKLSSNLLVLIKNNFEGTDSDKIFHESFALDHKEDSESVLELINERINIF